MHADNTGNYQMLVDPHRQDKEKQMIVAYRQYKEQQDASSLQRDNNMLVAYRQHREQ